MLGISKYPQRNGFGISCLVASISGCLDSVRLCRGDNGKLSHFMLCRSLRRNWDEYFMRPRTILQEIKFYFRWIFKLFQNYFEDFNASMLIQLKASNIKVEKEFWEGRNKIFPSKVVCSRSIIEFLQALTSSDRQTALSRRKIRHQFITPESRLIILETNFLIRRLRLPVNHQQAFRRASWGTFGGTGFSSRRTKRWLNRN